ncbi:MULTISPECIES: CidA/LrgA family protein [unclassified Bradyrhizobium]|uniref:CidA/LrgA family protein n=1 Tax=unclassified Bradyrhizobium TaxID=2631580 RepID=UPI0028EB8BCD|nr:MULTISPECIES: CidA/LrgA family protein [unclassified Bradyrhizobium]
MMHRNISIGVHRLFRRSRLVQIGLLGLFWAVGEALARTTGLPLPGGIIGMALALALFLAGGLKVASMKRGANWMLAEMLLFFVPAVLALLDHRELFGLLGLKIFALIVVSTTAVMCVTALTIDLCYRWTERHDPRRAVA